jgi:excisionase family DNA binding protein
VNLSSPTTPKYITLEQAQLEFGIAVATLRDWTRTGKLPGYQPGRRLLIVRADLENLIQRSDVGRLRAEQAADRRERARRSRATRVAREKARAGRAHTEPGV